MHFSLFCFLILVLLIAYIALNPISRPTEKEKGIKLMAFLGSGGHTAEMLKMMKHLNLKKMSPMKIFVTPCDSLSQKKFKALSIEKGISDYVDYRIDYVPRAKNVAENNFKALPKIFGSFLASVIIAIQNYPEFIIVNGPGTCVVLCYAARLVEFFYRRKIKIIYIESFCRTKTLSLSGKCLYPIADHFFVQWPELVKKYPKAKIYGKLL